MKHICKLDKWVRFYDTVVAYAYDHPDSIHFPKGRRVQTGVIRDIDYSNGELHCSEGSYKLLEQCSDPKEHDMIYPNMCYPERGIFSCIRKLVLP